MGRTFILAMDEGGAVWNKYATTYRIAEAQKIGVGSVSNCHEKDRFKENGRLIYIVKSDCECSAKAIVNAYRSNP